MLMRRSFIAALPILAAACTDSQPTTGATAQATPWPPFQPTLGPATTTSPNLARMPDGQIVPASERVPDVLRQALGRWRGWNNREASGSVALTVEEVNATGGRGTYVFANASIPSRRSNWTFTLVNGNELRGRTAPEMHTVTVRIRPDGHMDLLWQDTTLTVWASGVLTRVAG